MRLGRLSSSPAAFLFALSVFAVPCNSATVLVLHFRNISPFPDLNWVGESISETLQDEFTAQNQIVLDRSSRTEALRRLSLRADGEFTKATLIRLGQSMDADYVCYGSFDAKPQNADAELKSSLIQISARFLDLRKLHAGPDLAEGGKLTDLSRLEEHLAWQALRFFDPSANLQLDAFLAPQKLIRVDAEESYIRGLLSNNKEQKSKWFTQALALDPKFTNPAFELGDLSLSRKEYRQAINWFSRISSRDSHYSAARFKMGLAAYNSGDYNSSGNIFRELSRTYPLGEVFNNLAASENQLNQPAALEDFRRAAEGDPNDIDYLFNLGGALLKASNFTEAVKKLQDVISHDPDNSEARELLFRAQRREAWVPGEKTPFVARLKDAFDPTAFRQLKAVMQTHGAV